jgi:hypothetical protein
MCTHESRIPESFFFFSGVFVLLNRPIIIITVFDASIKFDILKGMR